MLLWLYRPFLYALMRTFMQPMKMLDPGLSAPRTDFHIILTISSSTNEISISAVSAAVTFAITQPVGYSRLNSVYQHLLLVSGNGPEK